MGQQKPILTRRSDAAESGVVGGAFGAPSLRAVPFEKSATAGDVRLLTDKERQTLAAIATSVRLTPRTILYRENAESSAVFVVERGVMKSVRHLPSGKERVTAFLFPEDLFGLAENGYYVSTAQAVGVVLVHRLPLEPLKQLLQQDALLEFKVLSKVTDALRSSLRHTILLGRRDAAGRLAMFLRVLRNETRRRGRQDIEIPMSRSDIANFLGLSLEAVSRASRRLTMAGIVEFQGRHGARIRNQVEFDRLVATL